MGKVLVAILATMAALALVVYFVGASRMTQTAFNVPGTEHTHPFSVTWTLVCGGLIGFAIWRIVKGK